VAEVPTSLRFRILLVPEGKDDEAVAALLDAHALDGGTVEVPLTVAFRPVGPAFRPRAGGVVRGLGFPSSRDPEFDADVESEIARRQRVNATADQLRLDRILFDLDHQRTMPQEDVERLSAEADAIRRRLEARGQQIVDIVEQGTLGRVIDGHLYPYRSLVDLKRDHPAAAPFDVVRFGYYVRDGFLWRHSFDEGKEDDRIGRTGHVGETISVERLGQSIPRESFDPAIHAEVPTPATIAKTPRSQAVRRETSGS
jgi:hypothetical protein